MIYSLPNLGKDAIRLPHFPTLHQAFIFRAYEYIPLEKIANVLDTSVENVLTSAREMGLPDYQPGNIWLDRGYITIIRRMWHILPYSQLLQLLDMSEEEFAVILRDEDFLDIKLGDKPICHPVKWRPLTDEERLQTSSIKSTVESIKLEGVEPFNFEYNIPPIKFGGEEKFSTRMIYAFSGLYQHAFDVDSESYLPDNQLLAYKNLGINGIWTQGVLSELVEFPFEPSVSVGYEKRIERINALTDRLAKFGIKLYLYINEPRYMPQSFFEKYPHLRGHIVDDKACLCTSTQEVRDYLKNSISKLCRAIPNLGGFFTITRSENLTNCYSHSDNDRYPCTCPRCRERSLSDVVSETINCISEGAHEVNKDIKVFAWSWNWDNHNEDIIRKLKKDVILLSESELCIPFEIGGVEGQVYDYSMSIVGPGERAISEWKLAKECGLQTGAKVQVNTTWEASTVPAIPVSTSIDKHIQSIQDNGVSHLLLSWTLGGYPSRNLYNVAKFFYEKCDYVDQDEDLITAEKQFAKAFSEFPFDIFSLYYGPQNIGPANLLFAKPTNYLATMTCFAYDDLERWRSIYPIDVYEKQYESLCSGWLKGLGLLPDNDDSETSLMAYATYCLYKSSLNQIKFIRARDDGRYLDAIEIARDEEKITRLMIDLMNKNASIGYEAANHYFFSKGQLVEKIVNVRYVIDMYLDILAK